MKLQVTTLPVSENTPRGWRHVLVNGLEFTVMTRERMMVRPKRGKANKLTAVQVAEAYARLLGWKSLLLEEPYCGGCDILRKGPLNVG